MEFIFKYPLWYITFCVLLGFVYAFVLYYKTKDFPEDSKNIKIVKKMMAFLRFLSVSILSFLLLSPFIKTRFIDKIKPVIIIAHDNSSSINLSFKKIDSLKYINSINTLKQAISEKYDLDFYSFSDNLKENDSLNFIDKKTNISKVLNEINGNYYNRNVGAVILATDGIYNEGQNPSYLDFSFPLYSIALGDTSNQKDLKIVSIHSNKIAFLNDKVQVLVNIEAYNLKGKNYTLSVYKHKKGIKTLIKTKKLKIKDDFTEETSSIIINANSTGIQKYSIILEKLENEITYENNSSDFYIDVIDSRQKILILANSPHPDIAVLKQTITSNKNFDLTAQYIKNFSSKIENFDLIILHQLPSITNVANNVFSKIQKEKIPYFIITGASTNYQFLKDIENIVTIEPNADNLNDATPFYNPDFNIFNLDKESIIKLKRFPPISLPFGNYKANTHSNTILFQQIGAIDTEYPILSFSENFGVKSAIFIGEGLWKWKLHDYLENKNHDAFNDVFSKTINYLALKSDKRKFRVYNAKNLFYEGETILINAELYNENYELINTPEVSIIVKDEKENKFPLVFNRTNNAYEIKTNGLPIGNYSYVAKTIFNDKKYSAKGAFSIKALQIEALQTKANHKILYQLAQKTNAKVFYPKEINQLQDLIVNKEDIKPTLYESFKTQSIINLHWIFYLIMFLLSVEWFARKYFGAY